jgi:5-methylcytosine-specific restriction endonuclease McrA
LPRMPRNPIWLDRLCLQCGAGVRILKSQTKGGRGRFCSKVCARRHQFIHKSNISPMSKQRYADNVATMYKMGRGQDHPGWQEPIRFTCIFCQVDFLKKPWQTRGGGKKNLYCSIRCRSEHRKTLCGPNAPDWVGGKLTYHGRDWPEIRARVVAEQAGTCARCEQHVGSSLPVHHIIPFRCFESWDDANRRDNLVGMCQSCHMKTEPRGRLPRIEVAA